MIQKPDWLFKGAIVLALGEKGIIKTCPTTEIKGKIYVHNCGVKLEGAKYSIPYHPSDLTKL